MRKWLPFCRIDLRAWVAFGLLAIAFTAGDARAGFLQITVSEGATSYVILDEGPLDTLLAPPPDNINKIQALAAALVFPDYKVIGLHASTNNPGAASGAFLTVGGEVRKLTAGSAPLLVIDVTDTDFSLPSGGSFTLHSSASDTFSGAPAGDSHKFTSWFNPSNTPYAMDDSSGLLTLTSSMLRINSHSGSTSTSVPPPTGLYGLTDEIRISLSGVSADLIFGGSTQLVDPPLGVPEPASAALLGIGGLGLLGYCWRRRGQAGTRARGRLPLMKRLAILAVVLAATGSFGTARAGILQITVSEGATSYVILDEGPLDTLLAPPPDNINNIQALAAALVFPDYKIVGLGASTNNPGAADPNIGAVLTVNGEVQKITSGTAPALTIMVTDTDYSTPSGTSLTLYSSTSDTYTNAPMGDSQVFTSWFNPSNAPYATDQTSGTLTLTSSGLLSNSNNGDTAGTSVGPGTGLYGLTNETVITMSDSGGDLVFGGSTQVLPSQAVPEPASCILLGVGGFGLLGYYWRRSRQAAT